MSSPKTADYVRALRQMRMPGGRQLEFLRAHAAAPGGVMTARRLARAAGYRWLDGINLRYGLLAQEIGRAMGRRDVDITLLVEGVRPKAVTNREWILAIRREFVIAMRRVGWI